MFGLPLRLPADLAKGPVALAFVGPLQSPLAREALAELQACWPDLDRAGVKLVAFSPTPAPLAQDYVPRTQLIFPLVLDEDRVYAGLCGVEGDVGLAGALKGLTGAGLARAVRGLGHLGLPQRAPYGARSALILLGRDGRVCWASQAAGPLEPLDVAGLLAAVVAA